MSIATDKPPSKSVIELIPNAQEFQLKGDQFDFQKYFDTLPLPSFNDKDVQSSRLPNSKEAGFSSIYRSSLCQDGLISTVHPDLDTSHSIFQKAVELYGERDLFGVRKFDRSTGKFDDDFTYQTYNEIATRRTNLGSGIKTLLPQDEKFVVSLFSPNRPEWLLTQLASSAHSLTITALYDTLGANTAEYILNFTDSPILFCPLNKISNVLNNITTSAKKVPNLKYIISMDPLDFDLDFGLIQLGKSQGISIMSIHQLEKIGEQNPVPFTEPTPDTRFGISFTSGTTGNPKGVVLNHEQMASGIGACIAVVNKPDNVPREAQYQSYCFLPLAHIYELLASNLQIARGSKIAFPHDPNPITLVENLKIVKPHFISLVPRVLNKFEAVLKQGLNSDYKGQMVLSLLLSDSTPNWLKKSLQNKTRKVLGFDRLNFIVSGSAPINPSTAAFLSKVLGVAFKQGYGLTESTSGTNSSSLNDSDFGSSGSLHPSTDARLRDVPEMGYLTTDSNGNELEEPQGELLLRGPQIFKEYYKNQKATDEVLQNGWFSTGDIATFDKYGRVYIIDRVKNFFKLAQGEYISPEKLENIYLSECPYITQIFITGKSVERYLVGIVGLDPIAVKRLFKKFHGFKTDDDLINGINSSPELKKYLLNKMNSKAKELQGFEKIHNLKVAIEPLKITDETITPTQKIKRNVCNKFFRNEVEELYQEGDLIRGEKI
ncbi:Long chain fatty acyl-CoA synthetase [Wickerhamomyces ciferrii]|uniref:Long chain fatty acyl-CoA synthetase n=1 Tax=Wickerhamomyces ciferrii (strain ATCC 14091 / BCRC 22168 / CBS 111 / JCM 3599 / NBRC 0793 / NRRL Y-1031 F-60-10) TaxID=1206466 RepID=K0KT62_WICCF|nr:Long chain fatty acyl-CoA synthetase [Wickerhamomyces ciferrii]CCH44559.1 Long chain fatty acyl-CoA synthetase [Wickerhamomyces ciferrii]